MRLALVRVVTLLLMAGAVLTGFTLAPDSSTSGQSLLLAEAAVAPMSPPASSSETPDRAASAPPSTAVDDPPSTVAERQVTRVGTMGDSSMMFMNAAIADALGPTMWTPVPAEFTDWTSGTGGFDRMGCGVTGDEYLITPDLAGKLRPSADQFDEAVPGRTCDWRKWIPEAVRLAEIDTMIVSWGPTTMLGFQIEGKVTYLADPQSSVVFEKVRDRFTEARQSLLDAGVDRIVWVVYPKVHLTAFAEDQPWSWQQTVDAQFALLSSFADDIIDLRDMSDPANFVDGLHFNDEAAARAAERIVAVIQADS